MRLLPIIVLCSLLALASCLSTPEDPFNSRLQKDVATIDAYLTANSINAIEDVSGVRYSVEVQGTGYVPRLSDKVSFDYTGKILNGSVFQTSSLSQINISELIVGFKVGLTQIPVGSSATFYIPSGYGYGTQGQTNIPPNSILVFEVTLKSLEVTNAEKTKLASDTVSIDDYIANSTPAITDVVKDKSGLRYKITELGTGTMPGLYNKIRITYSGYLLTNGEKGTKFYEGTTEPSSQTDSRVVNFIRGFQLGLVKFPKGTKATLYIPSGMGFGTQPISSGSVNVPANSNLIYDIELLDVLDP